jgi:Lar family restriction alleviation protein
MKQTSNADAGAVKLLPCPFCGSTNCSLSMRVGAWKFAYCPDCLTEGPAMDNDSDAISTWNRRAPTAEQTEGVRVLTADDADMVWPDYDSETFHHSIDDAVEYEVDQEWPVDGELELKVQLAKRIPTATIRIFNITEHGHEWEIVAAPAASAKDQS